MYKTTPDIDLYFGVVQGSVLGLNICCVYTKPAEECIKGIVLNMIVYRSVKLKSTGL